MVDSGSYDDATLQRRYAMAQKLLMGEKPPIRHWAEGLGNMAESALGGYQLSKLDDERKAGKAKEEADLYRFLGKEPPAAPAGPSQGGFQKLAALLQGSPTAAPTAAPIAPGGDQASYPAPPPPPPAPTTFRPGIAAPAAPVAAPDPSLPRGLRNNNPLNIEAGDFTKGQPGFVGSDGRFARFETPEQGTAAASKLLDTYESKYGLNTPAGIIGRWAPQGENNSAAYAATVAKKLGIGPNDPITPEMRPRLIAAMSEVENGRPAAPPIAPAAPTAAPQIASALTAPTGEAALPPGATPAQGALPTLEAVKGPAIPYRIVTALLSRNPTLKSLGMAQYQQLAKPETTDEIKEYNLDSAQRKARGEQPLSFFDFKAGLKKAGATNVSVDASQKGENKFEEKASSLQAERFDKIVQGGSDAKSMVSDLQSLRDIGLRVATGKTAEVKAALGPYAEALGVKIDGLDDLQAFKAITSRLAPQMRVPGSGATSDFEMRTFLEGLPGLGKTPEGNELISKTLEALAQHKIAAAEIASKALNGEIKRKEADKMLRELPDPLALWKQTRGEMKSQAEPKASPAIPQPGEIRDGYRFKGGNPADQKNWEQIS